ncbi:MAG: hypothetical protein ACLTAJ_04650 [Clostridium sp.]|uniref:hypothetical protein n=1 Tax=Clostridium sp. TaxID=1506 RepID=UPI0039946E0A
MKKKFLSLMMAATVVATTSVSAFAQDYNVIEKPDNTSPVTNVQITGSVTSQTGQMPDSTFKVTVPTTATFSVNKSGGFTAPDLTVKNEGSQKVDVYAYSFKDDTKGEKINILSPDDFDSQARQPKKRSDVKITLRGDSGEEVHLSSTNTEKHGVNSASNFSVDRGENGFKLLQLEASTDGVAKSGTISINGTAGTESSEALSDTFVLTLKIKKSV